MVKKSDLPEGARGAILHCPSCVESYSANPGDYWNVPDHHVFTCDLCRAPMVLARQRTIYVPWGLADAALTRFLQSVWAKV